jgi:hypothetical protein
MKIRSDPLYTPYLPTEEDERLMMHLTLHGMVVQMEGKLLTDSWKV